MKELIIESRVFYDTHFFTLHFTHLKRESYKVNTCKTKTFENLFFLTFILSLPPSFNNIRVTV